MPKEYSRTLRIGEQIRRELAVLIQQEVKDPRLGMVTVAHVKVSQDLSHAKVYVTVLGGEQSSAGETLKALGRAAAFLRHELGRRLVLRVMPQLHFVYDESQEDGARLVSLIDASIAADRKKGGEG
ncbi:MAG: 30S ribosome-binding factor RbfA [Gammaproteobacteria bacterium]|nr:30S ribosome-binding factor RbfA [Gammaproteobacteria bacterium]